VAKKIQSARSRPPDLTLHQSHCTICSHDRREDIESAFLDWQPQAKIASDFKLGSRLVVYRHARACGLIERRNSSIRNALGNFIERCGKVRPTGQSFVAACVALSRLDSEGHSVDRVETRIGGLDQLFGRMTRAEMKDYAETGNLPRWWLLEHQDETGNSK
jgi:hypothetical protein